MLQVAVLRQNPEWAKERLQLKHFAAVHLVDEAIQLDDERKKLQAAFDHIQSQINASSKTIGQLMAQGKKEEAEAAKQQVATWKTELEPLKTSMADVEQQLTSALLQMPNLPGPLVPVGRSAADNEVVRQVGDIPTLFDGALPHWDIAKKYNWIDFELGNKITGSGFPVYIGKGAKLQRALIQYFLDANTEAGYIEYLPPFMVNEASAYGTGQLPDKEGQMYYMPEDNFYMIPTAEVPVTNVYRDEILKEGDLPIKLTAYSPCFRREAGSYGKDVRGLNRLHQFEKVEIIQFVQPDKSYETLDAMVHHVEQLVQSLDLPYRILRLCGGDMSFASALTYDFEVYSAAQQRWLEVSSVSNFESFQANRLKARYKDASGKTQLLHTLNGSSLALPRILAALLENHQTEHGIRIPTALQPYVKASLLA
ncbi:MAG TPA: serine--tRNA ligase [Chitinophagaceae bacterium]|nr:serine--tRNA ligase [Chitinophagaceae bacterium]HAN38082.1 serine--tRNA ligase [Chitinophagaceae bacterium]